jgi:hypothetical protein
MQSVPITTNVASSNPFKQGVLIQHYVINLSVTCDRSVVFSGTPVSSINKTDRHDITEILLKVALNTITLTPNQMNLVNSLKTHRLATIIHKTTQLLYMYNKYNSINIYIYIT